MNGDTASPGELPPPAATGGDRRERERGLAIGTVAVALTGILDLVAGPGLQAGHATAWAGWAATLAIGAVVVRHGPAWLPRTVGAVTSAMSMVALLALAAHSGGTTSPYFLMAALLPLLTALIVPGELVEATVSGVVALVGVVATMRAEHRPAQDAALWAWMFVVSTSVALGSSLASRHRREAASRIERERSAAVREISERRRLEEILREADRRKNEFLGVLSHELRNPLAPIRTACALLRRADPGSSEAVRAVQTIGRQTEHLARLVDDLLDVTRITRGKVLLERQRFDLRDAVHREMGDQGLVFEARGLRLSVSGCDEALPVDADPARLSQVLGNLLRNAAQFTPPGGNVTVAVARRGEQAVVTIRDDGVGIASDLLPTLFLPFVQADGSLDRSQGGLGLGLALVKEIVELHGGTVRARSDGVGRGAEFEVALPLAGGASSARAPAPPGPAQARPLSVLLVEDNEDAAELLRDYLSLDGHRVEIAADGARGVERAAALRPDVVICDIGLPGMDGYEVARRLRSARDLDATTLVAVTGYALGDDVARARAAGFDHHLAKPADLDELGRILARCAGGRAPAPAAR